MHKESFKITCFVTVLLKKNQKILLLRRYNTGSDDDLYACPGGSINGNEPIKEAAARELKEEIGINVKKEDLTVVHVVHRKRELNREFIIFFIETSKWDGDICNMEPDKHDDLRWVSLDNLPLNTISTVKQVIPMIKKNIFYSELGWD